MRRRRRRPVRLGIAIAILAGLSVALHLRATWETNTTILTETEHRTGELTGELRVTQLSDFHSITRVEQIDHIVSLAKRSRPHLVALTGDLINTHNPTLEPVERLVGGLATLGVPLYYVDGNHEHWSADHARLLSLLRGRGVHALRNQHVSVHGPWGAMTLIGTDDYYTGHGDLAAAVAGAPAQGFRFVITHAPEILPDLDRNGIDYAICGHTHGGQIRLPLIGALYQAGGQILPRISKGQYCHGAATLFIDSGIGVSGPPYRLFNQSQITLHRIGP